VELAPLSTDGGPFSFGDPAFVGDLLTGAGWSDVGFEPHLLDMYAAGAGTVEEIVETGFTLGPLREMLVDAQPEVVDVIRRAVTDDFAALHDGTGVPLEGAIAIVTARR
jgi:hypothetical protein